MEDIFCLYCNWKRLSCVLRKVALGQKKKDKAQESTVLEARMKTLGLLGKRKLRSVIKRDHL